MLTVLIGVSGGAGVLALARAATRAEPRHRVARIGPRSSRMPAHLRRAIDERLASGGIEIDAETALLAWSATTAATVVVAASVAPGLVALAMVGALVVPPIVLDVARSRFERRVAVALPELLEAIASHLRSGGTITAALRDEAASSSPLGDDLRRIGARLDLGAGLADALEAWVLERDLPGCRAAAGALATSATLGGGASDALDALAASLRDRLAVQAEARAQSTQARWSAVVVGLAPLAHLAFTAATDSRSLAVLVATGAGRVCLVGGLALLAAGGLVMRSMLAERW